MSPHGSLALSQMRQAYFHTGFEVLLVEIPDALAVSNVKDPMAIRRGFRVVMTLSLMGLRQLFFFFSRAYFKELHGLFPLSCEKDAFQATPKAKHAMDRPNRQGAKANGDDGRRVLTKTSPMTFGNTHLLVS